MQLTQSASMRMEQRQLLTPRMIQSMEILQLPLMALEERIEQEMENNPVLELKDPAESESESDSQDEGPGISPDIIPDSGLATQRADQSEDERALVVRED